MKKLPHEMLRDGADRAEKEKCLYNFSIGNRYIASPTAKEARRIADVFEKYYSPIPRDPEGNPVHEDMEVDGGVVKHWSVSEDGSWTIFDNDYEEIQCGDKNEPIRLPEPKVLDADGVEIKVGDTVWHKEMGIRFLVTKLPTPDYYSSVEVKTTEHPIYTTGYDPNLLTHREPDSLEKLRDDIDMYVRNGWNISQPKAEEFANRLTAIMERDA